MKKLRKRKRNIIFLYIQTTVVLVVPALNLVQSQTQESFCEEESALGYENLFCLSAELLHSVIYLSECPGIAFRHLLEYKTNLTKNPGMQLCITGQELWHK